MLTLIIIVLLLFGLWLFFRYSQDKSGTTTALSLSDIYSLQWVPKLFTQPHLLSPEPKPKSSAAADALDRAIQGESNVPSTRASEPTTKSDESSPKGQRLFTVSSKKDDLKKIKGIGPVMEKTLNELGVTSFKQLAEFNQDDIKRVSDAMKVFPGRIERDEWVSQAKEKYQEKYGLTL
ncbi:MAG: putative flap endonuclease-1-like 5' DNA nuclease [bacterium]|jgi:predicted flap endonuclease-1-like 5' DNA nuclease